MNLPKILLQLLYGKRLPITSGQLHRSDPEKSITIHLNILIVGGQSGNPFSPHYGDLPQFWLRGQAIKMPWTQESIQRNVRQTLKLLPNSNKNRDSLE